MTTPERTETPDQRSLIPSDITLDQLLEVLIAGGIPVDQYGVGNAKTVLHLLSEMNEGESVMTIDQNKNVYREVNVLGADVLCELADGNIYILKEDRQEFKDGRVRRRELRSSIGEKLKPLESPEDAVSRALYEELGIEEIEWARKVSYDEQTFTPDTFPGIESTYKVHTFATIIPENKFNPDGYVEYQQDKTNYYVWKLLHERPE